jgi:hypothetical protein
VRERTPRLPCSTVVHGTVYRDVTTRRSKPPRDIGISLPPMRDDIAEAPYAAPTAVLAEAQPSMELAWERLLACGYAHIAEAISPSLCAELEVASRDDNFARAETAIGRCVRTSRSSELQFQPRRSDYRTLVASLHPSIKRNSDTLVTMQRSGPTKLHGACIETQRAAFQLTAIISVMRT